MTSVGFENTAEPCFSSETGRGKKSSSDDKTAARASKRRKRMVGVVGWSEPNDLVVAPVRWSLNLSDALNENVSDHRENRQCLPLTQHEQHVRIAVVELPRVLEVVGEVVALHELELRHLAQEAFELRGVVGAKLPASLLQVAAA